MIKGDIKIKQDLFENIGWNYREKCSKGIKRDSWENPDEKYTEGQKSLSQLKWTERSH